MLHCHDRNKYGDPHSCILLMLSIRQSKDTSASFKIKEILNYFKDIQKKTTIITIHMYIKIEFI